MQTVSLEQAVAMIPDGASLMVGGFMAVGTPAKIAPPTVRVPVRVTGPTPQRVRQAAGNGTTPRKDRAGAAGGRTLASLIGVAAVAHALLIAVAAAAHALLIAVAAVAPA